MRINDPQFLDKLIRRLALREQGTGDVAELIIPTIEVGDLLSTASGVVGGQRVVASFAGEMNALTTATFGASRHYPINTEMRIRQALIEVVSINQVVPTGAGRDALNAYIFVTRQATPTYAANINAPNNLLSFSGAAPLPFGAGVNQGTIISLSDALELYVPCIDQQWVTTSTFAKLRATHENPRMDLLLKSGDFLGIHADIASTATYGAGTIWDVVYKAKLVVDIIPAI